ncbi:hypothetical protein Misp02_35360 [Microtetraspora sp. NBRC 16547]|nr:hypothetical protein Misp02_35360 [Microtetraspora sp. NBRC 16547]
MLALPPWLTAAFHAWAAVVAAAVVALGYHWPSDAIAGWALGIVLGSLGRLLAHRLARDSPARAGQCGGPQ